ncbi:MAG: GNAT family N-acetyltransferase [Clostridiales bacterium]|nr:GNAT family N-acetyltransferase [Clostridiales bacterium]MCF8023706.1 GNAT family N-acetyltransferase [Clostridiales bacterium]
MRDSRFAIDLNREEGCTMYFKDLSNQQINACIEENLIDFCFLLSRDYSTFICNKNEYIVKTDSNFWANFIYNVKREECNLKSRVQFVKGKMQCNEYPSKWVVGPSSSQSGLEYRLEENGFEKQERWIGMAADLTLFEKKDLSKPDGLMIKTVEEIEDLSDWVGVASKGLCGGKNIDENLFKKLLHKPYVKCYLGLYNGKPAATSMLFLTSSAAGIYLVSTLSEYRKMGIGNAVVLTPLLYAASMGYHIAILQASEMGRKMYKKIGFNQYGDFSVYEGDFRQ